MSSTNSDLKSFAVFINSKSAVIKSSNKSQVTIPFTGNIAYHDPFKVYKFTFVDMLFTNAFYNIRPRISKLKVVTTFAVGRGFTVPQYKVLPTIDIPYGSYDFSSLINYINPYLGSSQGVTFTYGATSNVVECFEGFGAISIGTNLSTQGCEQSYDFGKLLFNSPDMWNLMQPHTDITTIPTNLSDLPFSYIVSGVYLIVDSDTAGLMKILGLITPETPPTAIPDTPFVGYGIKIYSKVLLSPPTTAPNNTTLFGVTIDGTVVYGSNTQAIDQEIVEVLEPYAFTDLSGLDELYIHCPQFRTQFLSSTSQSSLSPADVIAVIPISVPFGSKMSFIPNTPLTAYMLNTNISQLDFTLTNSNNQLVDFHGCNWSITLSCSEEVDESKFQYEDSGTIATPFQLTNQMISSVGRSVETHRKLKDGKRNRAL